MAGTTNFDKKYIQSDAVTKAQQAVQNQKEQKPGQYQSQYQQNMTDLLGQIQNRGKFQYDINADALYQQAAQRYLQQGQQAMMDTMGQASALTGGYGNSYAQNAGQQAYQSYLQWLTDLIPQYRQMAMDQYQMEGDDLLSKYNLLASQEESEYGRYMDLLNQYYTDLDMLRSDYDRERSFDYGQFTDDRGFQYQQERDAVADAQWQAEFNEKVRQFNLLNGGASGGGGGYRRSSDDSQDVSLVSEATKIAQTYGQKAAMDYIQDQTGGNVSAESNNANANVKGVAQTEYYKKMMNAMKKK